MQSELKRSSNFLSVFWTEHSDTLKAMAIETSAELSVAEQSLKRKALSHIAQSASSSASSSASATSMTAASGESSHRKRLRSRKNKDKDEGKATINDSDLVESDKVYVSGCSLSVGTIIKRAAYQLQQKSDLKMTCRERKIMTSGLSSILDLSDDPFDSQRSLFTSEQRDELRKKYDNPLSQLDSVVVNYLKIACCTLELSNDYDLVSCKWSKWQVIPIG